MACTYRGNTEIGIIIYSEMCHSRLPSTGVMAAIYTLFSARIVLTEKFKVLLRTASQKSKPFGQYNK